ncbi:MAG: 50S ribosomal protein L4 [candidate division TM6 bacterium GW2011_GWE2_42_60]|nr:MAG: 50S ribosomal protein L4 [candidate division TM6 bacterium GW2011_GWE2_42_60]HBY05576.1 50S ribosomal protein L4 [Candidatus Dependentiae bacterium]
MVRETKTGAVTAAELGLNGVEQNTVSPACFAVAIRAQLQNWRQGTVACKGRSDVNRTGRKPWKQKGTGRARAGSFRSPIWRGGGVTFGPQPRVRTLSVPKQVRRLALQQLLLSKVNDGRVFVLPITWTDEKPKTSTACRALKALGFEDKKVILFVDMHDYRTQASFANVPNVRMLFFDQPNAYDLSNGSYWLYLEQDDKLFKEMVGAWI